MLLLLTATVILACVMANKISNKIGMPILLAFIVLGMLFGSDGILKIPFSDYSFAEDACSAALIFIMFYGGFGTNWKEAKPVALKALALSCLGTVLTAALVGLFCYYILHMQLLESFLLGSVISSTDAASVFSILRSKRLGLRYHTASLLEIESGSNDPFSYMLTVTMLSLINGNISGGGFTYMLFAQIVFGILFGFGIAGCTLLFLKRLDLSSSGFYPIFMVAVALFSYALPAFFGGNGYLSVYITGILLGNCRLPNKLELVHFFDGVTGLMQMLLFFLLGLLSFPSHLPKIAPTALAVALFLTFVVRPAVVFAILSPFRSNLRQQLLVSWSGLRGAASIVFAIMAVTNNAGTEHDIFHIVFFIVLFSILLQGTLLPILAKRLDLTDADADVLKTFNDYVDEVPVQYIQFQLPSHHPWVGKAVCEIILPPDSLLVMLTREGQTLIPTGNTILQDQDILILSGRSGEPASEIHLYEKTLEKGDPWIGRPISAAFSGDGFIALIRRGDEAVIPNGSTILLEKDILVISEK